MIINRSIEFVSYRPSSFPGTGRAPLFLRNSTESDKGYDTVEISEHARRRYLDSSASPIEKALLKADPGIELFREDLRQIESDLDQRRRQRVNELKTKMFGAESNFDEEMLSLAAKRIIAQCAGK